VELLSRTISALVPIQLGQVVERFGDTRVVGPQRLLGDGEAAPIKPLGLSEAALGLVDAAQPRHGYRGLEVFFTVPLAGQGDISLRYWDGVGVFALAAQSAHLAAQPDQFIILLRVGGARKEDPQRQRKHHRSQGPHHPAARHMRSLRYRMNQ
jgi:hypothetical protein